jgi:DNA-binding transcriptional LysR family regulator
MRGPIHSDELEARELFREEIVVMLPAHHALAGRKSVPVELLDDLPCITMDRSLSPALHDAIAALYRQAQIRMHAVSSADNVLGHLRLVKKDWDLRCSQAPWVRCYHPASCKSG